MGLAAYKDSGAPLLVATPTHDSYRDGPTDTFVELNLLPLDGGTRIIYVRSGGLCNHSLSTF
jgi:hypothetical protein